MTTTEATRAPARFTLLAAPGIYLQLRRRGVLR